MVRLQKFLADAGLASRRSGEQMILAGRVEVNGQTVRELGTKVDPLHDRVTLDGKPAKAKRHIYLALNKPRGLVCSRKDEFDRPTIYELLPAEWGHLHSVGRLDYNSEGLLFLTNDGEFSLRLTHSRRLAPGRKAQSREGAPGFGRPGAKRRGIGIGRREISRGSAFVRISTTYGQKTATNSNRQNQTRRVASGQMADVDRRRD